MDAIKQEHLYSKRLRGIYYQKCNSRHRAEISTPSESKFAPSSDNISRNAQFMIGAYGNSTGTGLLASSELNGIIKDVFVNKF